VIQSIEVSLRASGLHPCSGPHGNYEFFLLLPEDINHQGNASLGPQGSFHEPQDHPQQCWLNVHHPNDMLNALVHLILIAEIFLSISPHKRGTSASVS
jgi:hypothetical protein